MTEENDPFPVGVEHLDRPEPRPRRHADHADAVVQRADRAGGMGAVAVVVGSSWRRGTRRHRRHADRGARRSRCRAPPRRHRPAAVLSRYPAMRVPVGVDPVNAGRDRLNGLLDRWRDDLRPEGDGGCPGRSCFFAFLIHCLRFCLFSIFLHLRGACDASTAMRSPPGDVIVKASTGRSGTTAITAGLFSSPRIACGGNVAAKPSMTCS